MKFGALSGVCGAAGLDGLYIGVSGRNPGILLLYSAPSFGLAAENWGEVGEYPGEAGE